MVSIVAQTTTQPAPHPPLHPWILAHPVEDTAKSERQAKMYNILSKISLVAIAAIALSVLAVSLATSVSFGALPLILLGLILVTPCLAMGAQKLQDKRDQFQLDCDGMRMTAQKFKEIKHWQESDVLAFFAKHKIAAPENVSLPRLIPLIARFLAKEAQAEEGGKLAEQMLAATDIPDRQIRLDSRRMGWQILEGQVIPSALEAAFILHILSRPYLQSLPSDVYACISKHFDERQFDRFYDSDDAFLVIKNRGNQLVATLDDLRKNLSADRLYDNLFARN